MQGLYKRKTAISLLIFAAAAAIILLNLNTRQSVATSDPKWPEEVVSGFHASCIREIRKSKTRSPVVHQAVCNCQVAEMKRWLKPSDMAVFLAATKGRTGLREMVAQSKTLSRSEQRAFIERTELYRESTLRSCFKAGLDAALAERAVQ